MSDLAERIKKVERLDARLRDLRAERARAARRARTHALVQIGATLTAKGSPWTWRDKEPLQAADLLRRLAEALGPGPALESLTGAVQKAEAKRGAGQ